MGCFENAIFSTNRHRYLFKFQELLRCKCIINPIYGTHRPAAGFVWAHCATHSTSAFRMEDVFRCFSRGIETFIQFKSNLWKHVTYSRGRNDQYHQYSGKNLIDHPGESSFRQLQSVSPKKLLHNSG